MSPEALASRVEDAGLNASAPAEQRWLDGWLLRLSPGKAKRARCINALAPGRLPLTDRLQAAQAVYRDAGLPLVVRITPFSQPPTLDDELAALGWRRFDDTCVMLCADYRVDQALADRVRPEPVDAATFADVVGTLRGSPPAQRQAHAARLRGSPVPYRGVVLRQDGQVLACGQMVREGELVGLYDVFTSPEARRRGHARALCAWLLRDAAAAGARHAYLQVEADNHPARAVYATLGFADAYRYHYREPPAAAS